MRVFVTGATGFVGSAILSDLLGAGHQVLGLVRSDAAAKQLESAGGAVLRGSLDELDVLRSGVRSCDGVIHAGFSHDWDNYAASAEMDRVAIETMGSEMAGSGRPLVVTSGTALVPPAVAGGLATEQDTGKPGFPRKSEEAAGNAVSAGARAMVLRLPPTVHGVGDHGFVPMLIQTARDKGVSAYVGDGGNRWPAVHRTDAARLYRLVLEKGTAARYHAVADEGVPFREIAEVIGRRLNIPVVSQSPEEAAQHFGWFAHFVGLDCSASGAWTQQELHWQPAGPSLLSDIDQPAYFQRQGENDAR